MNSEIVVNASHRETRVALLENGQVAELYVERKRNASLVGNVYKGKVVRILPGMQSAFVDIGFDKAAFLYVSDVLSDLVEMSSFVDDEEEDFSERRRTVKVTRFR